MLMVQAGAAVDKVISDLLPYLESGDIVIDGGNSNYGDTIRRTHEMTEKGLLYVGTGVSGGEEGALIGPSIMPGGNRGALATCEKIFQSIAAKVETVRHAVIGSEPTGLGTTSRWSITALNTAICR
ncbi:MAG: hypothetical protein Ct9H300mP13_0480 [Gammaproteobacteria bacterium]|nr:MAG: hypothetical protein Ct9H300mP13_0480 [Gammaproteobacteria bacterium]